MMLETLILTWTIAPQKNVITSPNRKYTSTTLDPLKREKEYYKAIKYYLEKSYFTTIIFCDNSNYCFSYIDELEKLAKKLWKVLEFLTFQWDIELSTKISYGVWEAEILDYIYENSVELHKTNSWYKITGRYIVDNINEIICKLWTQDCYFNKWWIRTSPFHVRTSFFKISNTKYKHYIYKKQVPVFYKLKELKRDINLQLEPVRYILLRKYIKNDYLKNCRTKNIPIIIHHIMSNWSKTFLFLYRIWASIWLLDFNYMYMIIDKIFFPKYKRKIMQ